MLKKVVLVLSFFGICLSCVTIHADTISNITLKCEPHGGGGGGAGIGKSGTPKGSHQKNIRPSTQQKHEKADARRHREQKRAEERKENNKKKR